MQYIAEQYFNIYTSVNMYLHKSYRTHEDQMLRCA